MCNTLGEPAALVMDDNGAGQTVSSSVTVTVSQTLTGLTVTPANASLPVGQTQPYIATGNDQFGAEGAAAAFSVDQMLGAGDDP